MTQAVFLAQIISSQMALQDVVRCVIVCSELQCLRQSLVSRSASTTANYKKVHMLVIKIKCSTLLFRVWLAVPFISKHLVTMKERAIIVVMLAKNAKEINVVRNVVKTRKLLKIIISELDLINDLTRSFFQHRQFSFRIWWMRLICYSMPLSKKYKTFPIPRKLVENFTPYKSTTKTLSCLHYWPFYSPEIKYTYNPL